MKKNVFKIMIFVCGLTVFVAKINAGDSSLSPIFIVHKCPFEDCNKSYEWKGSLTKHLRSSHNIQRPFICQICRSTFRRSDHCRTHVRTHTGEKPFKCNIDNCSYKFCRSDQLECHKKTHFKKKKNSQSKTLLLSSSVKLSTHEAAAILMQIKGK